MLLFFCDVIKFVHCYNSPGLHLAKWKTQ